MLFRAFYSPDTLTSFDELLSRPYLNAVGSQPQPAPPPPTEPSPSDAESAAAQDCTAEYPRFEGTHAPKGWLTTSDDGTFVEHPLWTRTVTWGGAMRHSPMRETLQLTTVGDGCLQVFLPSTYMEVDQWKAKADKLLDGPEGQAEAEALYARFSSGAFAL